MGAALIRGRRLLTFLSQMRGLFEGSALIEGVAYSSKYGTVQFWIYQACTGVLNSSLLRRGACVHVSPSNAEPHTKAN